MWLVKFVKALLSLFINRNDRFLVVEIFENTNRAASTEANFVNKEIKVLKVTSHPNLKKLLRKFGRLAKYKIILSLGSNLASTIYSSIVLIRDNFKELIDEPELDNLISQAIWKFFDRQRNRVATKMGLTDLDILLADVKIRGVKLDGHKVVNPVGFKARMVEIQFSQTFLRRDFVNSLKELLPIERVALITENGTAWSNVVAKARSENNFLLANLFNQKTLLFLSDGHQIAYRDCFNWGAENLQRSLAADLSIAPEIADQVITRYLTNRTSLFFKKRLENLLSKELQMLARGLNSALKQVETKYVYLNPFFDLPNIFTASFKSQFDRPVTLRTLTTDLIGHNFGFEIKFRNIGDSQNSFSLLASLIEWHLSPHEDKMSRLAKRRVRWLSPT